MRALLLIGIACLACRRQPQPAPPDAGSASVSVLASASASAPSASASGSAPAGKPPARESFSRMLTLEGGNVNRYGKPNVWAHVPAAFDVKQPLHVALVFHGFSNCLESFVADVGRPCKPNDPPRTAYALAAQIEQSGSSAIVLVPQLAYDEQHGEPGVLDNAPALEKLTQKVLDALGIDKPIERVTMIALSGGYQALYATMGAFGDKLRSVFLLDAYYAEHGPVDAWFNKYIESFETRTRRLGVIYSNLDGPRVSSQGFAARAASLFKGTVHNAEPHDVTVDELTNPVCFAYSKSEHDDIPKTDIGKALAASR